MGVVDEAPSGAPYAAGELLVVYKKDVPARARESLERRAGFRLEKKLPEIDTRLVEFPLGKRERAREVRERLLEEAKEELERAPAVASADYNYLYTASYTPRDPLFWRQWGLRKTGFQKAWNKTRGRGRRIAIVDSGAALRHVDLRRRVVAKRDFRNDNFTVEDLHGHGTHVAGIVAARTGNGKGVAGGCPGCRLIIAKAVGSELTGYDSDIIDAIIWSARKRAKAINLSLGSTASSDAMRRAVNYATRKGAVVVAAAGNYGTNKKVYPAAYRNALAVAYTNRYDRRDRDSSYGGWVDVAAPGVNIISTVPGGYRYKSGSSMAAPHVSATVGLLASQGYGRKAIRRRILRTALDLGPRGRDPYYGHGRIRVARAVR